MTRKMVRLLFLLLLGLGLAGTCLMLWRTATAPSYHMDPAA